MRISTALLLATLAVACGRHHRENVTPVTPGRLAVYLPAPKAGWTGGDMQTIKPEDSKMRPEVSMAAREYKRGDESYGVAIIDPAWRTEVYAMYMSTRREDGSRSVRAPFEKIGKWQAVEGQDDTGGRELNVVVDRYIVSITTRSVDDDILREVFRGIDAEGLAKMD